MKLKSQYFISHQDFQHILQQDYTDRQKLLFTKSITLKA